MINRDIGVGVAAVIRNSRYPGKIITGIRKGSHGSGTLQLPGGHLEKAESFFNCAEREALEETGLEVTGRKVLGVTNDIFKEGKHYVTIFVLCDVNYSEKEPVVCEPDKCESWEWQTWDHLQNLKGNNGVEIFLPLRNFLDENLTQPV